MVIEYVSINAFMGAEIQEPRFTLGVSGLNPDGTPTGVINFDLLPTRVAAHNVIRYVASELVKLYPLGVIPVVASFTRTGSFSGVATASFQLSGHLVDD